MPAADTLTRHGLAAVASAGMSCVATLRSWSKRDIAVIATAFGFLMMGGDFGWWVS